MMRASCILAAFLILATVFPAMGADTASKEVGTEIEQGRKIYEKHCKVCHSERGDGATFAANVLYPPPRNFTSGKSRIELTERRMIESVTHGRAATAMMPWEANLSAEEIRAVVHFIRRELMKLPG